MKDLGTRTVHLATILVGGYEARSLEADPELQDLAASIASQGLLEPLGLRVTDDGLVLLFGHRRYQACIVAHLVEVPVHVYECSDAEAVGLSFAENFHRKDITPLEQAARIREVIEVGAMTIDEVAGTFRRSTDWVNDQVAMMGWPGNVQAAVHGGQISASAARELVRISDPVYRDSLLGQAISNGVTAATVRQWVWGWQALVPLESVAQLEAQPAGTGAQRPPALGLCIGCHGTMSPEGMVPVYLCPACTATLRSGGQVRR